MRKKYIFLVSLLALTLTACGSGAGLSVGGGGGSSGAGGGVGLTFPVGGDSGAPAATSATSLGSNLASSYPDHNCQQPMKPDPGDSDGLFMVYKQQLDRYRMCIDTYVKNAKNDMQSIENKANSALREYRQFVTMP